MNSGTKQGLDMKFRSIVSGLAAAVIMCGAFGASGQDSLALTISGATYVKGQYTELNC